MKTVKNDNKGFSLVELIVVVLIMAILAVALTPQVMKWVNNSRISADNTGYNSLVSAAQLALTDSNAYSNLSTEGPFKLVTTSSGTTLYTTKTGSDVELGTGTNFYKAFVKQAPDYAKVVKKESTKKAANYVITITTDGTVVKTEAPASSDSMD